MAVSRIYLQSKTLCYPANYKKNMKNIQCNTVCKAAERLF
jgi:hypothetical protein